MHLHSHSCPFGILFISFWIFSHEGEETITRSNRPERELPEKFVPIYGYKQLDQSVDFLHSIMFQGQPAKADDNKIPPALLQPQAPDRPPVRLPSKPGELPNHNPKGVGCGIPAIYVADVRIGARCPLLIPVLLDCTAYGELYR